MQNLYSNLTIICCQNLSIAISQSSKMYTNTTLNKNSAMNIFNFVFPLNREEKLYIISVYKCGRMSRQNFTTVHFQRLRNISDPILCLIIIQTNESCFFFFFFFCYSEFDYYRLCVILTLFYCMCLCNSASFFTFICVILCLCCFCCKCVFFFFF